jgi:hypothetical protein
LSLSSAVGDVSEGLNLSGTMEYGDSHKQVLGAGPWSDMDMRVDDMGVGVGVEGAQNLDLGHGHGHEYDLGFESV